MTLKDESPRLEGVQYVTGEEQRTTPNSPRKNEAAGPKQKWHPVVDMSGEESNIGCCKEQYCIRTWNVGSMNQGKLDVVKQEMVRININILGISEPEMDRLNGPEWVNLIRMIIVSTTVGKNPLEETE